MKILDRYILGKFLLNFFSSFVILILIFIFQTIWLYIGDLAGKGLDIVIIGKFIFYFIPSIIGQVLQLTVILTSILTFGTLAENYEFAAMKASGISLQRAMRYIIIFVLLLGVLTFFFENNVAPAAAHKIYNLKRNIGNLKPAAIITEGVFSDFEGMNIKVDKKFGENDRFLKGIIIHRKHRNVISNVIIKAKTGELISSKDSDILQLALKDGYYYEDVQSNNPKTKKKQPFAKANFNEYKINIELTDMVNQDLEEDQKTETDKMKNVSRLIKDIDSIKKDNQKIIKAFAKNISLRAGAFNKSAIESNPRIKAENSVPFNDSLKTTDKTIDKINILDLYEQLMQIEILASAHSATSNLKNSISGKKRELEIRYERYNIHILTLHKKYALSLSCIILFFVGAPLGAIIRKGGLGLPMVVSILFFLTYHFLGVFITNSAKVGKISPVIGAWIPTIIILILGVFFTMRATNDKGLINFGSILDFYVNKFKKNSKTKIDG